MDLERYLTILILRTLGLSQDEVTGLVRCAKQTVVEAERWFTICPQGETLTLVDDQRIRRLVGREFPDMGFTPNQLIKAGQITGDDILLHYDRVHPREVKTAEETSSLGEAEAVSKVGSVYIKLLERHWDRLREQAITVRTQLLPPDVEALFGVKVCYKVYNAVQTVSPLLSTSSWKKVIDAPFELRLSGSATERAIEVKLLVEKEFLFPHLISHFEAEFGEFTRLEAWKEQLGQLIQVCLEEAERISRSCSGSSGMYYLDKGRQKGLSWHFPAYVCQFILNHLYSETVPRNPAEIPYLDRR